MRKIVTIETKISQQEVINRIKALTGNQGFAITAPFSGTVGNDQFRISKNDFIIRPFIPVAIGKVRAVGDGSVVELEFEFPWLGHAAMITLLITYFSMPISVSLGVVAVFILVWAFFIFTHEHEKKNFVKSLREKL